MDIWDLKRHFELAVGLAIPSQPEAAAVQALEDGVGWRAVAADGTVVGWAGPLEADAPKWAAPLYGLEVRVTVAPAASVGYEALPTRPAVARDLSLVVPGGVTAAAIEAVLRRAGGGLLTRLDVRDEYRGAGLPAGTRGVTWRCTFRDPVRTLTEKEVDALLGRMLSALEGELDVRRREA
jgi:phenylalanyl-tRNA synthetase beta chain